MNDRPKANVRVVAKKEGVFRSLHVTIPPGGETERVRHRFPFIVRYRQSARLERIIWENGNPKTIVENVKAFEPYYRDAGTDQQAHNPGSDAIDFDKDEIECPIPEESEQKTPVEDKKDSSAP